MENFDEKWESENEIWKNIFVFIIGFLTGFVSVVLVSLIASL